MDAIDIARGDELAELRPVSDAILDNQRRAVAAVKTAALGPDHVAIRREDLVQVLLVADMVHEHYRTIVQRTPSTLGVPTLLVLAEAGVIDGDTFEITPAFEDMMVRLGRSLGSPHVADGGSGVGAQSSRDALRSARSPLAPAADAASGADIEADVAAAERALGLSPDPDWPDELAADSHDPMFVEDDDDALGLSDDVPDLPKPPAPVD
jgi:hypothetical protein